MDLKASQRQLNVEKNKIKEKKIKWNQKEKSHHGYSLSLLIFTGVVQPTRGFSYRAEIIPIGFVMSFLKQISFRW